MSANQPSTVSSPHEGAASPDAVPGERRRLPTALLLGIIAVLGAVVIGVFQANHDPRITEPLEGFPEVTFGPDEAARPADAFSLFGTPIDFQVYYLAGRTLAEGGSVYGTWYPVTNWGEGFFLPFTYPPFAAWLASYYATMSLPGAIALWQLGSLLILAVVLAGIVFRNRSTGPTRVGLGGLLFLILLIAATFAYAPVRASFFWGQVNVLVMGLAAMDFLVGKRWPGIRANGWKDDYWWAGIGVGLSAALKVYPAFFGLLFLLQGRWRAAITSAVTFFATVGIGFAFVPESAEYWTHTLTDTNRFGGVVNITSQSIQVALLREFEVDSTALWLGIAVVVSVIAAIGARHALKSDRIAVAMSLIGLTSCVISPFAWHHYYLWAITLIIALVVIAVEFAADAVTGVFPIAPYAAAIHFLAGAFATALGVVALWPYVSIVFFFPFDVRNLSSADNPFLATSTVWWSVFLIALVAAGFAATHALAARTARRRSRRSPEAHTPPPTDDR